MVQPVMPPSEAEMSPTKTQTADATRVRLLELLEEARPFAELMVYREGILPALAASNERDHPDCVDGTTEVLGAWGDKVSPRASKLFGTRATSLTRRLRCAMPHTCSGSRSDCCCVYRRGAVRDEDHAKA